MLRYRVFVIMAVLVAVLAGSRPVAAQSLGVLASAERAVTAAVAGQGEVEGAQDEGVTIRRMRSRGMAGLGAGLMGLGVALFVRPPKCGYVGNGDPGDDVGATYGYSAVYREGSCDVAVDVNRSRALLVIDELFALDGPYFSVPPGMHREYLNDIVAGRGFYVLPFEVAEVETTQSNTLKFMGLAIAAGGATLLGLGLRRIDVPFRVDLTPDGGVLASRSFGW